ncbi:MAG: WecB/TagA/CpsF family glycosyltransferase [Mycobacteriales bacterium]
MDGVLERCEEARRGGGSLSILGVNAAIVNLAVKLPELRAYLDLADIVLPDGMGVVWFYRLIGQRLRERVATPDLVEALLTGAPGQRIYLVGGLPAAVSCAADVLRGRGHQVVGAHHGFMSETEVGAVIADIRRAEAELVLVGMPSPKKEAFSSELRHSNDEPTIVIGVGGYLDVLAGLVPRAPRVIGRLGFEWAFRLAMEPRRLAGRYLIGNLTFLRTILRWRRLPGMPPSPSGEQPPRC